MDKISYVTSSLLTRAGLTHCWFTRDGGVSKGSFSTLNVKYGMSDPDSNVIENRRRAVTMLGGDLDSLSFIRHEHGTVLAHAEPGRPDQTADAVFSTDPEEIIGQGTADCPTLVVYLPDRAAALIHAGWRGLQAETIPKVMAELSRQLDTATSEFLVGIGPRACAKCYEFGPEALELFGKKYVNERDDKHYLDMPQLIADQLEAAGVRRMEDLGICTIEDRRFFSYRRDKDEQGECGRFMTAARLQKT